MNAGRHLTIGSAIQAILARTGLFAIALIFLTLAYWQLDPVGDGWWIVPGLLIAGLYLVQRGLIDRADHAAIARLVSGAAPRDGQWSAISGKAVPLDDGTSDGILACRFQISERERTGSNRRPRIRYEGFYLAPTGIDTGDRVVLLHGFPDMQRTCEDSLPEGLVDRAKAAGRRVPAYLLPPLARELIMAGQVNQLEDCIVYGDADPNADTVMDSWLLKKDEPVCVFGLWRDGTLRGSYRRGAGMPVYEGTAENVVARLRGDSRGFLILGGIVLTLALGVAVWSLI